MPIRCDECNKHDRIWDYKGRFLCEECLFIAEETECDCHKED